MHAEETPKFHKYHDYSGCWIWYQDALFDWREEQQGARGNRREASLGVCPSGGCGSRYLPVIREHKEDICRAIQGDPHMAALDKSLEIRFFYQPKPNGEAGAILAAAEWLENNPFVVHYPDNIIAEPPGVLAELIKKQADWQTDMVLLTRLLDHAQAGFCGLEPLKDGLYQLNSDETPSEFTHGLRSTGIYVATPYFLQSCRELLQASMVGEIKDRDVRRHMLAKGHKTYGVDLSAKVMDVGNPSGYQGARQYFSEGKRLIS